MERKPIKKKTKEKLSKHATRDDEQRLWEEKKLGNDIKHTERSNLYKSNSKLISIRIPEDVLEDIKNIADKEGLRYQTYIVSLLKKHVKRKAG